MLRPFCMAIPGLDEVVWLNSSVVAVFNLTDEIGILISSEMIAKLVIRRILSLEEEYGDYES